MAGFDYGRMQKTATRLMERFKQGTVTITRVTPGTPDPSTPWLPVAGTPVSYDLSATVSAITVDQATSKFIDGTTIKATDLVVTCAVPPIEPDAGDSVALDGKPLIVLKVLRLPAAGTAVAFKFIVKG